MLVGQIMGHSRGPITLASKGIPHGIHLEYMGEYSIYYYVYIY
jgi:hypothetical protein